MEREKLKSRLGFILISAGCAIGIGNVWKFPYVAGMGGGGAFVLFYIIFLIIIGIPIMVMEFSVGRGSGSSPIKAYKELEKPGQKWHHYGKMSLVGNYLLMMFYTTVAGWMLYYLFLTAKGDFVQKTSAEIGAGFGEMLGKPQIMVICTLITVALGTIVCAKGLQSGLERITKIMMISLILIIVVLVINSLLMPGAAEGLRFYLIPDFKRMADVGIAKTLVLAMNQAFFTLSIGIGSMAIFGSYIGKEHSLLGEAKRIAALDTFVAIAAGLIIFPACFTYGVDQTSGPSLIFETLPNIFANMPMGRLWGTLFFLFMAFAALSTVFAVFENIIRCDMELTGWSRKKSSAINFVLISLLSMPCVLGFSSLSGGFLNIFGGTVLDLEDFLVSNIMLPIGSLILLLFCTRKFGWGWKNFTDEANTGTGPKIKNWTRGYLTYVLPILILIVFVFGLYDKFFA